MEERRFSKPNIGVRFLDLVPSGRGGTGRRASFRGWWAQALAGSNPAAPTTFDCRGGIIMKRGLDLVRSILMYVENADDEVDADDMATERWPIEVPRTT